MTGQLLTPEAAARLVAKGGFHTVAGDESILARLPQGNWIGGTIAYFMGQDGGETSRDKVFVDTLPTFEQPPQLRLYDMGSLSRVCLDAPEHGYSLIIIPAFSDVHFSFARNAPDYPDMYMKPLLGWIAGVHLDDLGRRVPKVMDGRSGGVRDDVAAVLHVPLPPQRHAHLDILNLFRPGEGDAIRFPQGGFSARECLIDGQPANLAEYLHRHRIDTRLPLVADYSGAMVNVSIKGIDAERQVVDFYAPVFEDMEYRIAAPVNDYVTAFRQALPGNTGQVGFACNCILNYLYSELEGKHTAGITGPMTFGEVAYQLLNQTLVYLTIE